MKSTKLKSKSLPLISIVICMYSLKRYDMIIDCINSILENPYDNYEIILVIDGNKELGEKIHKEFDHSGDKIIIIENENNEGPSVSRNKGVRYAKGDIVAFIDDDAYVTKDWLRKIAKNLNGNDVSVVGGKLLLVYESDKKLPEELLWIVGGTYKGHPEDKCIVRNVFTGNMAARKEVFDKITFKMLYNRRKNLSHALEDTLFCVELNDKRPGTILYDPEMIAYHHVPKDRTKLKYIIKRSFSEGLLKARLKDKHSPKVLSNERDYMNFILKSIVKNTCEFKFTDSALITLVMFTVMSGYISYHLEKLGISINGKWR